LAPLPTRKTKLPLARRDRAGLAREPFAEVAMAPRARPRTVSVVEPGTAAPPAVAVSTSGLLDVAWRAITSSLYAGRSPR